MTVMPGWIDTHVHATWYFNQDGRLEQGGRGVEIDAAAGGAVRGGESLRDADGRLHDGAERGGGAGRRSARTDRGGRDRGAATADLAAADQREHGRPRTNPRVRAEDESGRRGRGEAVCHGEHTRRRQNDDDAGADHGGMRRGQGAGAAERGPRAFLGRGAGRGDGGLHVDRARHVPGRRHAGTDGAARRVFRPELPGAAQLPGQ